MAKDNMAEQTAAQMRFTARPVFARSERRHKFKIGEFVTLARAASLIRPKEAQRDFLTARFEITRLLPEQGQSFHYRVKDATTGQERVVAEDSILATAP